mmetsp:Transcript_41351/g.67062  ORF Transcript_41351/g.67062 Transcript_41351/m.67062 type:complete len:141 (-) Transcript_41351:1132-1554(-)
MEPRQSQSKEGTEDAGGGPMVVTKEVAAARHGIPGEERGGEDRGDLATDQDHRSILALGQLMHTCMGGLFPVHSQANDMGKLVWRSPFACRLSIAENLVKIGLLPPITPPSQRIPQTHLSGPVQAYLEVSISSETKAITT